MRRASGDSATKVFRQLGASCVGDSATKVFRQLGASCVGDSATKVFRQLGLGLGHRSLSVSPTRARARASILECFAN